MPHENPKRLKARGFTAERRSPSTPIDASRTRTTYGQHSAGRRDIPLQANPHGYAVPASSLGLTCITRNHTPGTPWPAPASPIVRLRLPDVLAMAKFSRSTLYARIAEGKFPPPRKDGRISWWSFNEVVAALQLTDLGSSYE